MERFIKEFNEKHNTSLNENGIKRYLDVKYVMDLCEWYIKYIDEYGNECAYTDDLICKIKGWANEITEEI